VQVKVQEGQVKVDGLLFPAFRSHFHFHDLFTEDS